MNTVWNSYGQLLQLPEKTSKKSKFFCRGLDIRVSQIMNSDLLYSSPFCSLSDMSVQIRF